MFLVSSFLSEEGFIFKISCCLNRLLPGGSREGLFPRAAVLWGSCWVASSVKYGQLGVRLSWRGLSGAAGLGAPQVFLPWLQLSTQKITKPPGGLFMQMSPWSVGPGSFPSLLGGYSGGHTLRYFLLSPAWLLDERIPHFNIQQQSLGSINE